MTGSPRSPRPSIQELLEVYETSLVTYAARLVGDVERGRDVVQDAFLRLVSQGDAVRCQPLEAVGRWLFTTCRNRGLDVIKREQRMKAREREVAVETGAADRAEPGAALERREEAGGVSRWLKELPEGQREALRLRFQHGFSYRRIAEVMGHSVGHVGYLLHEGMHALRARALRAERDGVPS